MRPQKTHTLANESDTVGVENEQESATEPRATLSHVVLPYMDFLLSHRAAAGPCD